MERRFIQRRQPPPSLEQCRRSLSGGTQGAELGNRPAAARDDQVFSRGNAVDHVPAVVPQLTDGDFSHAGIV
jgi:hypothetical protein